MTQNDLNRAVAHATGETVRTIARLGFGIADPLLVRHDPEPYDATPEQSSPRQSDSACPGGRFAVPLNAVGVTGASRSFRS